MSTSTRMSMVVFVALLCLVPSALGQDEAPPPLDCTGALTNLLPCFDFVSGTNDTVPPECCTALTGVRTNTPLCLCQFLTANTTDLGINSTRALELPGKCGVNADPSQCPGAGPAPAAAPPATPPAVPPTAPTTPVSAPVPSVTPAPPTSAPSPLSSPPPAAVPSLAPSTPPPMSTTPPPMSATPPPMSATPPPMSATPPPMSATPPPMSATPPPMSSTPPPMSSTPPPMSTPTMAPTVAPTVSPVAAPPPTVVASPPSDCSSKIRELDPCLPYVVTGSSDTPSSECCGNFTSVATDSPSCLCSLVNAGSDSIPGLNVARALQLPTLCNTPFDTSICVTTTTPPTGQPAPPSGASVTAASPVFTLLFVTAAALQLLL